MKNLRTLALPILMLVSCLLVSCEGEENFAVPTSSNSNNGTNSSYARMLTVGNFLYAVNLNEIVTFDASDPSDLTELDRQDIGIGIETIFHHNGILLVGSSEGTFTFTIEASGIPRRRGQFDYSSLNRNDTGFDIPIVFCDPVVASGNVAYATLYTVNSGVRECGREVEVSLIVVMDISDLENPKLITTERTVSPRGLAIHDDYLYVCNERNGLTVWNVSDPSDPTFTSSVEGITAYDVIVKDGILIVVGGSELIQYDYSNPEELVHLSTIDIT